MLIEEAYEKYSEKLIQAMIRFSQDEAAAEDAVSQAFTQALANCNMLEAMPDPAVKAWLHSVARNALVDMKRKESRLAELSDDFPGEYSAADPTDSLLAEGLLSRLPSHLRTPVYLKYYRGLNSVEIGKSMGLPAATVRTRLRTALRLMRGMMKGE